MSNLLRIYIIGCQTLGFLFYFLASSPIMAQIIPDNTLPVNSIVTPEGSNSSIAGGTKAGNNLFYSFEQFSIPNNGVAYFNSNCSPQ